MAHDTHSTNKKHCMAGVVTVLLESEIRSVVREELQQTVDEAILEITRLIQHKEYVTNQEASEITGRSIRTLDHLRKSGQIDSYMNGNRVLFKYADLISWIKLGHVVATNPRTAA